MWYGGAIHIEYAYPLIDNCIIRNNKAGTGAGINCWGNRTLTVRNCDIRENVADYEGGGIWTGDVGLQIEGCSIRDNVATRGAGMFIGTSAYGFHDLRLIECDIAGNHASEFGGGIATWVWDDAVRIVSVVECTVVANSAGNRGGGMSSETSLSVIGSEIRDNEANGLGGGVYCATGVFNGSTFIGNRASIGAGIYWPATSPDLRLQNSVIAFSEDGEAVYGGSVPALVFCCDIYGNEGGDWIGCISDHFGINGNFSADPLICGWFERYVPMFDPTGLRVTLHSDSPCLPGNHPDGNTCGLIGAYELGCGHSHTVARMSNEEADGSAVEETTWGMIKAGYR
jgi:hypothetical protein